MIRQFDVAYFMVSVDTLEDNTNFAKKESADFPILADPTKETARKYGVLADYSKFMLGEVADRWTYYIGPDGKILDIDKKVTPQIQAPMWSSSTSRSLRHARLAPQRFDT